MPKMFSSSSTHWFIAIMAAVGVAAIMLPTSPEKAFSDSSNILVSYPFEEASGTTTNDQSGNGIAGTLINGATRSAGKYGNAILFDGTNDHVEASNVLLNLTGNQLTLSAWVYMTSTSSTRVIMGKPVSSSQNISPNFSYALFNVSGKPRFHLRLGGTTYTLNAPAILTAQSWQHLAATYNGTNMRLYLNGVQVASRTATGNITSYTTPFRIGVNGARAQAWKGNIDDVRVYNRALNQAEIQADMAQGAGIPSTDTTPPTVALTAPASGATIAGVVNVSASAADNLAVGGVKFMLDGVLLGSEDVTSPYQVSWDTKTASNGPHTLLAVARDTVGNVSTSTVVSVDVGNDTTAPTTPTALSAVPISSSRVSLAWGASSDNVGVAGYRVYRNGTQIATTTVLAHEATGLAASTTYTFTVSAYDAAGNTSGVASVVSTTMGAPASSGITGLDFPSNDVETSVRFKFDHPENQGLPLYGPSGQGVTYIWKIYPRQQNGYYTTFFWGNDGTFFWENGAPNSYYGAHPYPDGGGSQTPTHKWEISVNGGDYVADENGNNTSLGYDRWYTQALRVWRDANGEKRHEFYYDLPNINKVITRTEDPSYGNTVPTNAALTFGDAPWSLSQEMLNGILRGVQIYNTKLSIEDIQSEVDVPLSTAMGGGSIWYMNINPTPDDITDKSGSGHDPTWATAVRPTLYSEGPPDTVAPTVSLLSPSEGAVLDGTVSVSATATDNSAVAGVRFFVNGTQIGSEDLVAPYQVTWDTSTYANGSYTLTASARDGAGNIAASAPTGVTVLHFVDTVPPTVSLLSPSEGAVLDGSIAMTATAADNVAVSGIRFFVNGTQLGSEDLVAPYQATWDTNLYANGQYAITLVARDGAGNTATSTPVSVSVLHPGDTTPPTVALTSPSSGATVAGVVNVSATAADNLGVLGVKFVLNGAVLGSEDTLSPYQVSWDTKTAGNGPHTLLAVARDAAGNVSTSTGVSINVNNDLTPPTTPPSLTGTPISSSRIGLSWGSSTDNVAVTGYRVYQSGTQIATTTGLTLEATGLTASTTYTFTVSAYDAAGNTSGVASVVSTTTGGPAQLFGLLAAYNFNEGSGTTLIDVSGNNRNGTILGSPTWNTGKNGTTIDFDGANDYVNLGNMIPIHGVTSLTLTAWIKRNSANEFILLGKQSGNTGDSVTIEAWNDGQLHFGISGPSSYTGAYLPHNDTSWHHVALVFDGTTSSNALRLKGYIDGTQRTLTFYGNIPSVTSSNTNTFNIGRVGDVYTGGLIDDFRVYNRALSPSEVQSDMALTL